MTQIRLPSHDCPVCGAKHILFSESAEAKNATVLSELHEGDHPDCVTICPKCHKPIAVHRKSTATLVPVLGRVTA